MGMDFVYFPIGPVKLWPIRCVLVLVPAQNWKFEEDAAKFHFTAERSLRMPTACCRGFPVPTLVVLFRLPTRRICRIVVSVTAAGGWLACCGASLTHASAPTSRINSWDLPQLMILRKKDG
ncbi:unnamed protein product [Sphagnum balticum]